MTAYSSQDVSDALARQRLLHFVIKVYSHLHPGEPPLQPTWYLQAMCYHLERVGRGELPRSMIWLMPRALKSITAAVAFPCWQLGRDPTAKIMIVTYGDTLSSEHADYRRQIMESDWYKRLFPGTVLRTSKQGKLTTTRNGTCFATSVEGAITGRGAGFIILDDCMRGGDQASDVLREKLKSWFSNTLSSRLNDKRTGAIVSIQQRLHEDDLPAFLLERGFACLRLPAIADRDVDIEIGPNQFYRFKRNELLDPVRFPMEVLERERLSMGNQHYSAQYLQEPVVAEGNLFKMEQFKRFERALRPEHFNKIIQSWDTAASELPGADWSVCTTWGWVAGRLFLLDIFRRRLDLPGLRNAVIAQQHFWQPEHVLIEYTSSGIGIVQELKRTGLFKPIAWRPSTGKVERMIAQTGQIEEGRVWLPAELDGLDTFLSELRAFPNGRHDDQVDTLIQVLEFVNWRWRTVEQTHTPSGRPISNFRGGRPPLPPLPADIR